MASLPGFDKLLQVLKTMRDPNKGCPWTNTQTHNSLLPYFTEELHEFQDAFEERGPADPETWEELGDVLYQVSLHAQLFEEKGRTTLDEIAGRLAQKVIDRHPHVFDPTHPKYATAEEANKAWEQLKAEQRKNKPPSSKTQRLAGIPRSLPSLQRAARIGEKAMSFSFDWADAEQVLDKVQEELAELREAKGPAHQQEELGDLLFVLAQYARKQGWDPEAIARAANEKFLRRFGAMERFIETSPKKWEARSMAELEKAWLAAKAAEKNSG
jgi:ATP diphosphatase